MRWHSERPTSLHEPSVSIRLRAKLNDSHVPEPCATGKRCRCECAASLPVIVESVACLNNYGHGMSSSRRYQAMLVRKSGFTRAAGSAASAFLPPHLSVEWSRRFRGKPRTVLQLRTPALAIGLQRRRLDMQHSLIPLCARAAHGYADAKTRSLDLPCQRARYLLVRNRVVS